MPVRVSYPGVYVQEVPSGVRTITGVSTSIAAFVGMVQRGKLNVPTRILNFTDYERNFGSDTSASEMTDQVRLFFQNGGQQAYVVRIARNAVEAKATVNNEFGEPVVSFSAKDAGSIGNSIRIEVDYNTSQPEATFNLTIARETVNLVRGEIELVETELYKELTMNPVAGRFIQTVLDSESALLKAEVVPAAPAPIQGYAIAGVFLSAANDLTVINNAIGAGNVGQFEISVDGGPFLPVPLQAPLAGIGAIQAVLDTVLATTGTQVTVDAGKELVAGGEAYFMIASNAVGGSVRLRRATTNDIAEALGLGLNDGGLEVDGYAVQRPAPTGLFSRLGPLDVVGDPANSLDVFSGFLAEQGTNVTTVTVTDINGANSSNPIVYAGAQMWSGGATPIPSLLNGAASLDAIATAIDAVNAIQWTVKRYGYRIILMPQFGGSDTDLSASISSTPSNAAIGANATGIFGQGANVKRYRLGGFGGLGNYINGDLNGFDGLIPQLAEYEAAFTKIARIVDLFNLLVLPRVLQTPGQTDTDREALWGPASTFCQARRAFLLIDPPMSWKTAQQAETGVQNLRRGLIKDHSALYWPRLQIVDPATGGQRRVDPAGAIAGVMARIDSNRGVWKAPAGLEADIRSIRGLEYAISDPENGLTNPAAVNTLRIFPNGIVSWGARTMDGFDNSGNDDYKYVPVRRLALFIEESLYRGLKFAVFEPNDEPLWAQIRLAAGAFMNNLFRQGAFQGQKARDAYFVKVDAETTTQNDINLGIVNVIVGFAPLKPAEFVVITIQQMAGQVQT